MHLFMYFCFLCLVSVCFFKCIFLVKLKQFFCFVQLRISATEPITV